MSDFLKNTWHDVKAALGILTRIPVQLDQQVLDRSHAQYFWAFPVVGLGLGGLTVGVAFVAALVFPPSIAALMCILVLALLTGALHEDGLADCADGFWGGNTPERRLDIMKDSQIGSYGTLALIFGVGLRVIALGELIAAERWLLILVIIMLGRTAMLGVMHMLANARGSGFAHSVGEPDRVQLTVAAGLTALIAALALPTALVCLVAAGIGAAVVALLAQRKIKGYTGDVLGATQQVSETAALLAAVALV